MSRQPLPAERRKQIDEHIALFQTDPERAHFFERLALPGREPVPTLLLTVKGRKSGRTLQAPLVYTKALTGYGVVGSKGGSPEHPHWYDNLLADPLCEIQVGRQHLRAKARVATGAERTKLWAQMVNVYPALADYQKSLEKREIPVVVLEPQSA